MRFKFLTECLVILVSFVFATAVYTTVHSQSAQPQKNRIKSFGQSLEKYKQIKEETRKETRKIVHDGEIIRVETNLVLSDVLVVNQKGNAILGLNKEDFIVTEDGAVQELELFSNASNAEVQKSIVLIIEVGIIPSFADRSLESAKKLVNVLGPNDRMAIVTTNIKLVTDFSNDKEFLKSSLQALKKEYRAGRHEYSSLLAVLNELFVPQDRNAIVIQQSYGGELASLKPMWESLKPYCRRKLWGMCERNFGISDVTDMIERSRATIYTIVPGPQIVGLSKEQQISRSKLYLKGYIDEIGTLSRTEKEKEDFKDTWAETEMREHIATQTGLIQFTGLSGGYTSFLEKLEDADDIY